MGSPDGGGDSLYSLCGYYVWGNPVSRYAGGGTYIGGEAHGPYAVEPNNKGLSLRTKRKGFLCVPEGTQRLLLYAHKLRMFLLDDSIDLRKSRKTEVLTEAEDIRLRVDRVNTEILRSNVDQSWNSC